jgi:hypothetical protein
VSTITRSAGLAATSRKTRSSSFHIVALAAFLRSGRFIVTFTTPPARSTINVSKSMAANILTGVGFNPYRKFRARPADYALVIAAVVVALALVAWAFFA